MREFTGKGKLAIQCLAVGLTVYQLYTEGVAPLPTFAHRSIHLGLGFVLLLLLYPPIKGRTGKGLLGLDFVLCLAAIAVAVRHVVSGWGMIPTMAIARPGIMDIVLGALLLLLTLEVTRRSVSSVLVGVALVFVTYSFIGPYIPGPLGHQGITISRLIALNYLTDLGTLGMTIDLSSGIIFAVVAFGAFMLSFGGGELLIKVATAIAGRYQGGPAKVAVIGSAFFGTISGSPVANVVGTGMYTIPMMKRLGYKPEFAGAVEACASTGGQIMPPVMGTAAFIMTEFLVIPYGKLILYALIPAVFYFLTIFLQVHLEAVKLGLRPVPREDIVRIRDIPRIDWILLLPVAVFIYLLLGPWLSVTTAAFFATVSTWVCFVVHELVVRHRVDLKHLAASFETPARQMLPLISSLAILGIIVYSIDLTGLATKLSIVLIELAGANVWLLMSMTMVASLVLGMGLPAVACYIFLAILAAPALVQLGVLPLAAHMFVFYFGIISAITPPVCLASYVAAGIAGADAMKTGLQGTKLGIAGYIVPYMFCVAPSLLLQGSPAEIVRDSFSLLVAAFAVAVAVEGCLFRAINVWWRIGFAVVGGLLVAPVWLTDVVGYVLLVLLLGLQIMIRRRLGAAQTAGAGEAAERPKA